jgi:hypothetical protein
MRKDSDHPASTAYHAEKFSLSTNFGASYRMIQHNCQLRILGGKFQPIDSWPAWSFSRDSNCFCVSFNVGHSHKAYECLYQRATSYLL